MQGPGRADIVNAGSGETRYSECRVRGRPNIVNTGSGETRYKECRVLGAPVAENALYCLYKHCLKWL
ncbi:unnamed protein product [Staurois parvus]|uniref:Pectinesterase n=1 Tax=Staurois parvus TaxID=386267 RepID=A0ABN9AK62_9NEOB|nr:unnamed protein product [Staurois parvus]